VATDVQRGSSLRVTIAEVLPEPLPLVLDEAPDESLSSWLNRHAEFWHSHICYGVSPSALNLRAGINTPSFARIDYWPTAGEACSIASAMRRTPEMILSMTHQPYPRPVGDHDRARQTGSRVSRMPNDP
jgi:hypothetical protein